MKGIKNQEVRIQAGQAGLIGDLSLPADPVGLVVFAHGSGSSRKSSRNRYVAELLQQAGLGTLLFDLLTAEEEHIDKQTREKRFDIRLLAERLIGTLDWLQTQTSVRELPIGLFGASTGAAAALRAAAERPELVKAVVSRGGRPDLAGAEYLRQVLAPTLLIVGSYDLDVLGLNQQAGRSLPRHRLEIVPGASHLFEEPGTLERAAKLAGDWFTHFLPEIRIAQQAGRVANSENLGGHFTC